MHSGNLEAPWHFKHQVGQKLMARMLNLDCFNIWTIYSMIFGQGEHLKWHF